MQRCIQLNYKEYVSDLHYYKYVTVDKMSTWESPASSRTTLQASRFPLTRVDIVFTVQCAERQGIIGHLTVNRYHTAQVCKQGWKRYVQGYQLVVANALQLGRWYIIVALPSNVGNVHFCWFSNQWLIGCGTGRVSDAQMGTSGLS
jgi:hypothetical protein